MNRDELRSLIFGRIKDDAKNAFLADSALWYNSNWDYLNELSCSTLRKYKDTVSCTVKREKCAKIRVKEIALLPFERKLAILSMIELDFENTGEFSYVKVELCEESDKILIKTVDK